MRRSILLSTATLICCGFSSFASAQYLLTASPTPAPKLYLPQDSGSGESTPVSDDAARGVDAPAKPSPFDLFSDDSASSSAAEEPSSSQGNSADNSSPESTTPVGRNHPSHSSADTLIAGAAATANNNNYFAPANWTSHHRRAPNHTYEHMMLQWCTDGLWDNYPAERAAQCARQAERLAGRHHCGNLGHAGHFRKASVCGQAGQAGCSQCDQAAPQTHQPGLGCNQAATQSREPRQYAQAQYAQAQLGPNGRPAPMNLPPAHEPTAEATYHASGKVALQPLYLNR